MKEIIELLQTIKEKAYKHSDKLTSNETLTRYTIVDPILRHLGWDLTDPDEVVPEYRIKNLSCDYGFFKDNLVQPHVIIETKSLHTKLVDKKQIGNYIANSTARFAIFTDGKTWKVIDFKIHPKDDPDERTVMDFDILDEPTNVIAIKLSCLSKSNLFSDKPYFFDNQGQQKTTADTKPSPQADNFTIKNNGNKTTKGLGQKDNAWSYNKYNKRLSDPNSFISQILAFIKENNQVTRDRLETFVTTEARKSTGESYAISGSYSRTIEALEKYNYVKREDWISGKWTTIRIKK